MAKTMIYSNLKPASRLYPFVMLNKSLMLDLQFIKITFMDSNMLDEWVNLYKTPSWYGAVKIEVTRYSNPEYMPYGNNNAVNFLSLKSLKTKTGRISKTT